MLPVSWVHKGIHRVSTYDHSLDETTLILPGVVAAIVLVVQHSLALAFSLAGIIAGVQFRRALQDTFDALFILVAIGTGISAGVKALEIAAVLTVFFCYATLYVYYQGDGLESDFEAERRRLKAARKAAEAQVDD
jgi:phosphotransferase system  glucose/maltose/N-acetylglucosamine-specific IIC component